MIKTGTLGTINPEAQLVCVRSFFSKCFEIVQHLVIRAILVTQLMHSWGFALREGVFAENKEGICRNEVKKASFKKFKKSSS